MRPRAVCSQQDSGSNCASESSKSEKGEDGALTFKIIIMITNLCTASDRKKKEKKKN